MSRFRAAAPTVALVGVHGYGLEHLGAIRRLGDEVRLTSVVDPRPPAGIDTALLGDARHHTSLAGLLAEEVPDVVVVATPIHTHASLATQALEAGAHVLLEKPPAATLADFAALSATSQRTGRACQVGFQSLGSSAYEAIDHAVAGGEIGQVRGIGAVGTWSRTTRYYARASWAGRRRLDGVEVVDGVVTNPLAHAVATALRIDGSTAVEDVVSVDVDLYRANDIASDDTSAVSVRTARGTSVALGLTLCAAQEAPPRVVVHGSEGSITYHYTLDSLEIRGRRGRRTVPCGRTSLLANLLAHAADPAVALVSPLAASGGFMRVLEAVRTAPDPRPIPTVEWRASPGGLHAVVPGVEGWCERVADELRTFTELGAPWTGADAAPGGGAARAGKDRMS